jgi:dipeptidyl aminopeptidase/acylaminoacyl peptidase
VHGGGNNAYGNDFHVLEQLLAQKGFVILAIEYRGGAWHGRAFQDLSIGEFGAGQGWDAVAAAEFLDEQPYTNGKVGIYGGSYGGIMTMAAVTRDSEPFDAAAPYYGIYDWADAYQNADRLAKLMILGGHHWCTPEEAPELYEHTASLRHLDEVERDLPFLVTHGKLDRRAPFRQSKQLVGVLQERGNPVEYHWYPEEHHGYRKPKNREDAYGRLIAFFKDHLTDNNQQGSKR